MRPAPHIPRIALRALALGLVITCAWSGPAQARDDVVLEHLLRECRDYKVRVRAAEALGRSQSSAASAALAAALVDRHPAVRAAAATALGQLGAADALPALRLSTRDPVASVAKRARQSIVEIEFNQRRLGLGPVSPRTVRYRLYIGELRDRSRVQEEHMLPILASSLDEELRAVDGAEILSADMPNEGTPVYRVDGSIMDTDRARIENKVTAHASVALLLTNDADQTLRIVFKGAATTIEDLDRRGGDQPDRVARIALERAVRAALRNASSAMSEELARR